MSPYAALTVKVWGDYALFTQPEMKVERVSYPVMTPSAARGMLDAIFWKPEFEWQVQEIQVLKPIRFFSIVRNEVTKIATDSLVAVGGFDADAPDNRTQRHALILRDVAYVIVADIHLRSGATEDVAKYRAMFRRRVHQGQCFQRPYMGCREFAAHFSGPHSADRPIPTDLDIGTMLFDMHYAQTVQDVTRPIFFQAQVRHGVLRVPVDLYQRRGET